MADFDAQPLLLTDTIAAWDVVCLGICKHKSAEECVAATHLVFPYRGVYILHVGRLVLLRHSFCTTAFCRICPQQGHRGKACAKVRARRMRKVAIEFGMWRCERSGRTSGSITDGKGRLRASPGAGMS